MTSHLKTFHHHFKSKLLRKLIGVIFITSLIPVLFLSLTWMGNRQVGATIGLGDILILILMALLLAIIISIYLSRNITTPISEITKSATEIARGNFSHKISVSSTDEFGRLARLFNYMTTELRRLDNMNLAKIIAERNKTQTILRNIADGVIVTDTKSRILLLNSYAEKWFNLNEKEVFERPISELIEEPKLLQLIGEATSRKYTSLPSVEITTKVKDEWKPKTLQARAARVQQEDDELIGIVTVLRDVTQQKEIDRMKTELVSMVAHELRSPLTSISGFSELLLDPDTDKDQSQEYAGIILKEASRLSDLINKFLDISRIESGRITPKKTPLDITDVIHMVVGNNSYLATQKNIQVDIHAPTTVGEVYADNDMMEQVFLNLFSNAIKYSPENTSINIMIKQTYDQVVVKVHDQGYGIPPEALEKIFEKFYRVSDTASTQDVKGSGLGLSLVKQIIDMHGGSIEVESKVGSGSVFSVYLPLMDSDSQALMSTQQDVNDIIK